MVDRCSPYLKGDIILKKLIDISEAELKILQVLWERQPRTMPEITRTLAEETNWSKNTVITLLKRMIEKGTIKVNELVSPKEYTALVDFSSVAKQETKGFMKRMFCNKPTLLISNLISEQKVSDDEIDEIIRMLQAHKEERT